MEQCLRTVCFWGKLVKIRRFGSNSRPEEWHPGMHLATSKQSDGSENRTILSETTNRGFLRRPMDR